MVKYRIYQHKGVVEIDCKSTDFVSTEDLKNFLVSRNIPLLFNIRFKDRAYKSFYYFISEGHIEGSVSEEELGFVEEPESEGETITEEDYDDNLFASDDF